MAIVAIVNRKSPKGIIHHSDQGVQYAAHDYVDILLEHGFQISMARKGNPYDNAMAESFMKTLKTEESTSGNTGHWPMSNSGFPIS